MVQAVMAVRAATVRAETVRAALDRIIRAVDQATMAVAQVVTVRAVRRMVWVAQVVLALPTMVG